LLALSAFAGEDDFLAPANAKGADCESRGGAGADPTKVMDRVIDGIDQSAAA
jgi:hypothetical protein